MKKVILTLFACLLWAVGLSAQNAADKIIGTYFTDQQKGKVAIEKKGNTYVGTLIWTRRQGAMDDKNPDSKQRTKPLVGTVILNNLIYKGDNNWGDGTIYDPESGNTYSCKITRQDNGSLKIRGFLGVSLLGRTTYWEKIK